MKQAKLLVLILVAFVSLTLLTSCNKENKSAENLKMKPNVNAEILLHV